MLDIAIVGGGPAGLSASIYAARAGLDGVILEQNGQGGGQIWSAGLVDNYLGLPDRGGAEVAEAFFGHAGKSGLPMQAMEVETVQRNADGFTLLCKGGTVRARAVVYAAGAVPRKLGVPGEERLIGKGVSYCAACDGAFFQGKTVAVVGGGDTAAGDALTLARRCDSVHILLRRGEFRAAWCLQERLNALRNVTIYPNTTVTEIRGEGHVEGLRISEPAGEELLPVNGVFVAVGVEPRTGPAAGLGVCGAGGYIPADETGRTAVPGFYAAGGVRKKPLRQLVTAVADGANCIESILEDRNAGAFG